MAPKLYKMDISPPTRAVYMTAKALGLQLEYIEINLTTGDHLKPEFVKINPQHTIPALDDQGTILWDSHAINSYLVTKYGKDDSLYPKDPVKRAMVDQRLHFDSGNLFSNLKAIARPIFYFGHKTIPENLINDVNDAYEILNNFLKDQKWLVGDNVTIADFSALSSVTSMNTLVPIDSNKYLNIIAWIKRAEGQSFYEVNKKGLEDFRLTMQQLLS